MNRNLLRTSRRAAVVLTGAGLLVAMTAGPSSAATDLCISVNGTVRVQMGTAKCSSVAGAGNVAIARGANSSATAGVAAGDTHNQARATGANSLAFTGDGSGNTATATATGSFAAAALGDGNTATTTGIDAGATAEGTNQTAIASVLTEWKGSDKMVIGIESHGRESISAGDDLSRTTGWFTSLYPMLLCVPASGSTGTGTAPAYSTASQLAI